MSDTVECGAVEFGAVPRELAEMNVELLSLGGGDATIAPVNVSYREKGRFTKGAGSIRDSAEEAIIQGFEAGLVIRNPFSSKDAATEDAWRRYKATSFLDESTSQEQVYDSVGANVVEWVLNGFNGCVITYGQRSSGKSYTLFGDDCYDNRGLIYRVVEEIWDRTQKENYTIGMSVWEVFSNDHILDMFRPNSLPDASGTEDKFTNRDRNPSSFDPVAMKVTKFSQITDVFDRFVGKNLTHNQDGTGRAHLFTRFTIYDTKSTTSSFIQFVDLLGLPKGGDPIEGLDCDERHRRECGTQLLGLSRLINEVSQKDNGRPRRHLHLESLRSTSLNHLLGPILAGNCRTWFLSTLSSSADDYFETTSTLRIMSRALNIKNACYRVYADNANCFEAKIAEMRSSEEIMKGTSNIHDTEKFQVFADVPRKQDVFGNVNSSESRTLSNLVSSDVKDVLGSYVHQEPEPPKSDSGNSVAVTAVEALHHLGEEYFHGTREPLEKKDEERSIEHYENDELMTREESQLPIEDLGERLEKLKSEFKEMYDTVVGDDQENDFGRNVSGNVPRRSNSNTFSSKQSLDKRRVSHIVDNETVKALQQNDDGMVDLHRIGMKANSEELKCAKDEIEELTRQNSQVMLMFRRERQMVEHLRKQMTDVHADFMETNTNYEVELETLRAESLGLKSKCRQLESETTFADVFDKYEREIEDLTRDLKLHREELANLKLKVVEADSTSNDKEKEDVRISQMRKLLRKSNSECEKYVKEIERLKQQNRHYEFHKKGHEEAYKRISNIQKSLNKKEKECIETNLKATEQEVQISKLVADCSRREEEVKTVSQENAELVETIRTLNEDMQEIRLRRRTESLLVKLPTMKLPMSIACKNHHGCKTSKNQGVALDLARRLQREIEQTPRIENTFHRLVKEIEMMEEEKDSMERREALLVQMLTQSAGIQKP